MSTNFLTQIEENNFAVQCRTGYGNLNSKLNDSSFAPFSHFSYSLYLNLDQASLKFSDSLESLSIPFIDSDSSLSSLSLTTRGASFKTNFPFLILIQTWNRIMIKFGFINMLRCHTIASWIASSIMAIPDSLSRVWVVTT